MLLTTANQAPCTIAGHSKPRAASCRRVLTSTKCSAQSAPDRRETLETSRRCVLQGLLASGAMVLAPSSAWAGAAAKVVEYLPPAGIADFVRFTPDKTKTPALRAGTIDPSTPYTFALPPNFREAKVSNTLSGNFCQPRCGEPWVEVIFEDEALGRVRLFASPLVKLTNKAGATVEDLGSPEQLLPRIGSYITGTYLDDEDLVASSSKKQDDGRTYYFYEINAVYGTEGPHTLTAVTTKGDAAYIFVAGATDKQWSKAQQTLAAVVESFRA